MDGSEGEICPVNPGFLSIHPDGPSGRIIVREDEKGAAVAFRFEGDGFRLICG